MTTGEMAVRAWERLRSGGVVRLDDEIPSVATMVDAGFGPARYAIGARDEARLLLPLAPRERLPQIEVEAISIDEANYLLERKSRPFIELTCLEPELEIIFGEIVASILDRISRGEASGHACQSTIEDYRSLLASRQHASDASVCGLLGELSLLETMLELSPVAWRCWRGPLGDRHDFRAGSISVEVKSSRRRGSQSVVITSLEQLLAPTDGELFLLHCHFEQAAAGALSVGEVAARCCAKSGSREKILGLIRAMGCSDPFGTAWNELRFNPEGRIFYTVSDGFPRLTSMSFSGGRVPPGVIRAEYTIDLSLASSYALSDGDCRKTLRGMIDCLSHH